MATGLYIDASALGNFAKKLEGVTKKLPQVVSDVLNRNALEIEKNAKRAAPADRGFLRQGISSELSNPLQKHITSHAPYSAWIEFGTDKKAQQYVSTLPAEYAAFAAQFRGKGGGTFAEFIRLLAQWVKRKGIAGTYSVKTRKRTGNKAARQKQDLSTAYAIALSILKNGVTPHPFMIPALIRQRSILLNDLKTIVEVLNLV